MSKLAVVILAAGQGTRMRSVLPKVLHPVAGKPMLQHALDSAMQLGPSITAVVHGHGSEQVRQTIGDADARAWVEQIEQNGTGHAVQQTIDSIAGSDRVLVLYGDVPLLTARTLQTFIADSSYTSLGILTMCPADPHGYGRIVRDSNEQVSAIVEQKDATPDQLEIGECNSGILCADTQALIAWLKQLDNNNAQGELYLTDVVAMAVADGVEVASTVVADEMEVAGVNDRVQLAKIERVAQARIAEQLLRDGTTLADPARIDVRGQLCVGRDGFIDVNCVFEGEVTLGDNCKIGPNCLIQNSVIGDDTEILANSVIDHARVGDNSRIGPFARLRPDTVLAGNNHIGNFVEIKKSQVGDGSKINHLSYVGDSEVGKAVNIGAGTITCNYDGVNKHKTVIGDRAFIGSDSQLVAPVTIGDDATIGAGSTITANAPPGQLTFRRPKQQISLRGWKRPTKKGN